MQQKDDSLRQIAIALIPTLLAPLITVSVMSERIDALRDDVGEIKLIYNNHDERLRKLELLNAEKLRGM